MSTYKYTAKIKMPNGKYKYVRANTRKELEEKKLNVRLELRTGVDLSDKTTFKELYEMWFRTYKVGKTKPQTSDNMKAHIEKRLLPLIGGMKVKDITPLTMAGVFSKFEDADLSNGYQRKLHNYCCQIFDIAVENSLISKSPMAKSVQPGGEKAKKKEALTSDEVKVLLDYMKQYPEYWCMSKFLLATGLRIGELLALKWNDVDMDKRTVHVHATWVYASGEDIYQESPKTTAGNRTIPFNMETKQVLLQMKLLSKGEFIWNDNGHMGGKNMYERIKRKFGHCNTTAHILRHTCITNWIMSGMPVSVAQHLAGHSSSSMTLDVYTSYSQRDHLQIAQGIIDGKSATLVQPNSATECNTMLQAVEKKA